DANRLARLLVDRGAGPGAIVAVVARRSPRALVAQLAVVKTGAAYLPVDPAHPQARVRAVLLDAAPALALVTADTEPLVAPTGIPRVRLDDDHVARDHAATDLTDAERVASPTPATGAYLVYTSGSTGTPKGVLGTHAGLVNRLAWYADRYPWRPGEVACAKTSFGFVDAIAEVFGPLSAGATVVLADDDQVARPTELAALVERHGVGRLTVVPSLLAALLDLERPDLLASCRLWVSSGEALPPALARRFAAALPDAVLVDFYGSSEASADSLAAEVRDGDVTLGTPLWNTRVHVLDPEGRPVLPGGVGELHLAGVGLAHGYRHRPATTAERFVPAPFGPPGTRLYRTGDLVRVRPDGALDYLGRDDDQVKIRGMRLHLGEVEATLLGVEGVTRAAAAVLDAGSPTARLVAYVVPAPAAAVDEADLVDHLRRTLPPHAVPTAVVVLDELPTTPTGKLDRRALPVPAPRTAAGRAPATPVEHEVAEVWADLLGASEVDADTSFFALGGHSLLVPRMAARVRARFGVDVPLRVFFEQPTVARLADAIVAVSDPGKGAS
ncbi:MAG: non-ribosomal peptide synthetase, partial [Saccharothrix sp.]|nr:non-ribosomal peptide synthetase [Saccharothrix sp.]